MKRALGRHDGDGLAAGFGAVSREERHQAELFFATLLRPPRSLRPMSGRPRDQALLRTPAPTEHQTTGAPVLQAGNVGPAVNGTQNTARLALVSPSGALDGANDLAQINALTGSFTNRFNSAGHQVAFDLAPGEPSPPHVAGAYRLAGTDAQRWASLRWGLFDPATSAAIAIRGGHGATRLLDELAAHVNVQQARRWPLIPPLRVLFPPKRVAGFSDFTAVLLAVHSLLGWASIHGPMLSSPGNAASQTSLIAAITTAPANLYPNNRVDANLRLVGPAPANPIRGVLLGGNLALVDALYGSPFFPSLQGALLFVEETNEEGRKIDRMIEGLKHRGAAGQVRAVVVGRTTNIDSDAVATLFHESWRVPCVSGLASGHGNPNHALWVGLEYELQFPQAGRASLFLRP
jgi:muramoyltetrapeptide carboxypeptidase